MPPAPMYTVASCPAVIDISLTTLIPPAPPPPLRLTPNGPNGSLILPPAPPPLTIKRSILFP